MGPNDHISNYSHPDSPWPLSATWINTGQDMTLIPSCHTLSYASKIIIMGIDDPHIEPLLS